MEGKFQAENYSGNGLNSKILVFVFNCPQNNFPPGNTKSPGWFVRIPRHFREGAQKKDVISGYDILVISRYLYFYTSGLGSGFPDLPRCAEVTCIFLSEQERAQ